MLRCSFSLLLRSSVRRSLGQRDGCQRAKAPGPATDALGLRIRSDGAAPGWLAWREQDPSPARPHQFPLFTWSPPAPGKRRTILGSTQEPGLLWVPAWGGFSQVLSKLFLSFSEFNIPPTSKNILGNSSQVHPIGLFRFHDAAVLGVLGCFVFVRTQIAVLILWKEI